MTDQSHLVSVILPLYNRAESIVGAINSVLEQSYRNLELIVVDDASTDQSIELVEAISDPRIRLLRHETNQGAAAARNTGIEAAKGGYVAFQDSDDEWLPEKLDKQMQVFLAAPEGVGAVYCGFVRMGEREPAYIPGPEVRVRNGNISRELLHGNFVSTQTLVVRRKCFRSDGMFWAELPRFQDWELVLRLADEWEFLIVDEPLVKVHATEMSITNDDKAGIEAFKMILDRHCAKFQTVPSDYANLNMAIARLHLTQGAYGDSRHFYWKAIKTTPFGLRPWLLYFVSFLGRRIFNRLLAAKRAVQRKFR